MKVASSVIYALCFVPALAAIQEAQEPLGGDISEFQIFSSPVSEHSIRIKQQDDTICDAHSAQYTGWLDVGSHHLFFWYFESQHEPLNDPLVLWMNGGPGASSMLGLLQELGPCLVNDDGDGTVYNPYGWTLNSSMVFVDQPAGVGFSYQKEGEPLIDNSFTSAEDMHVFLQIFTTQVFPKLSKVPFHIAGESYGGRYIPALAAEIQSQNVLHRHRPHINLQSVLIGNGVVSPADRAYGYWETLCTTRPGVKEPLFNETRCDIIAANIPRCGEVLNVCYEHPDPAICNAARNVCIQGITSLYDNESGHAGGRNRFDITKPCEVDGHCYFKSRRVEEYLNSRKVWNALGIPPEVKNYTASNGALFQAFLLTNDEGITMRPQIQFILETGIDVLIYQGKLDLACNTAGNLRWTSNMPWKGQAAFNSEVFEPWVVRVEGQEERIGGEFKEVEIQMLAEGKTRFAFFTIDGAGHMVPQDQPEAALQMFNRWLAKKPFA